MTRDTIVLQGRRVYGGMAEGEALVTHEAISGWGGVNPVQGTIIETRHELRGQSFKDRILVFRGAKGSSGWSVMFHTTRLAGTAPSADLHGDDHEGRARRSRDAGTGGYRLRSGPARAHRYG